MGSPAATAKANGQSVKFIYWGRGKSARFSVVTEQRCAARRVGERESVKFSELAGGSCAARGAGERESVKFSELARGCCPAARG